MQNYAQSCTRCSYHAPSHPKEPLKPTRTTRPMQQLGVGIFDCGGQHYLCAIDKFSGFPFAAHLRSMTTATIIKELERIFQHFGYARVIRTGNGPAFRQEFKEYCQKNGMRHETSSPLYPQSNGHADNGLKTCKHLLQKHDRNWNNFQKGLLEWKNTPKPSGFSPAQLMFGRAQKTAMPRLEVTHARIDYELAEEDRVNRDLAMKKHSTPAHVHCHLLKSETMWLCKTKHQKNGHVRDELRRSTLMKDHTSSHSRMEESCVAINVFFGKSTLRFFSSVHTTANVQSARYPILPRPFRNLVPHCILFL